MYSSEFRQSPGPPEPPYTGQRGNIDLRVQPIVLSLQSAQIGLDEGGRQKNSQQVTRQPASGGAGTEQFTSGIVDCGAAGMIGIPPDFGI